MKWTIGAFPEFDHLDAEARQSLLKQYVGLRIYASIIFASCVRGLFLSFVLSVLLFNMIHTDEMRIALVPSSGIFLCVTMYQYELHRIRKQLKRELKNIARRERLPVCFHCGYDLSKAKGTVCPECGTQIAPGVHK